MSIRIHIFCLKKTDTQTQKAKKTKEEKRKTRDTIGDKGKENVALNSICGKCNGIREYCLQICSVL